MGYVERPKMDRTAAKKYFKGAGFLPWVLIIIGVLFIITGLMATPMLIIGLILALGGGVWLVSGVLAAGAYERQVDEIIASEQEYLLQRGASKLNLVEEQTGLIEPIKTIGMGNIPVLLSDGAKGGFFGVLKSLFSKASTAPVLKFRFDKEGKVRYSLIQANVFLFGETQLYIYFANVDITTGLIYHEGTHEYFYKDICGLTTDQQLESKLNRKTRKVQNVLIEFIHIFTAGCNHKATFDSSISGASLVLDKQFAAMRGLVREKKEEK